MLKCAFWRYAVKYRIDQFVIKALRFAYRIIWYFRTYRSSGSLLSVNAPDPFSHIVTKINTLNLISAFIHEHNTLIQIILHMRKMSSGSLLSIHTFCSIQWFCYGAVKALIRLRGCAGWSGPSLSAYARRHVFACRGLNKYMYHHNP